MTSSWSDHVWSGRGRFMCFAATLRHISTVARRTRVDVSFDDHAGSSFFFERCLLPRVVVVVGS